MNEPTFFGELLSNSAYFGVTVSLAAYAVGLKIKRRVKKPFANPLLISIVLVIVCLLLLRVDYESYKTGAQYLSYLLTPATVCLAIPLYQQIELLRKNWRAVLGGIAAGVVSSLVSVLALSAMFALTHEQYVSLLPKSITTAIGMGVSEELGGIVTLTVASIILTGVLGSVIGEWVCRIFRIREKVAVGIAMGTASHAIGTSRALEMGEIEGAMSSLSIAVAGLLTVAAASLFAGLY